MEKGTMNHSGHHMGMGHTTGMPHHTMGNGSHMGGGSHMDMGGGGGSHDGHQMNGTHDPGSHMGMDMMKMYFHTGITEYVLFKDCQTGSTGGMIGACFVIFVAAVLYEGLKFLREVLLQSSLKESSRLAYAEKDLGATGPQCSNVGSRMFSGGHFLQTVLHVVQVFISYCLMLVFMTYNLWLCLAVVLGAGVGYFLFGWKRAVVIDANEHCH